MLDKLMTVRDFSIFEKDLCIKSNILEPLYSWTKQEIIYLGTLMIIDSSFLYFGNV